MLQKIKEDEKTDMDQKQTGKSLFMEKYGTDDFADITEDDVTGETKEFVEEEEDIEPEEEKEEGDDLYDKDQFAAELQDEDEEEPDFD